MSYTNPFTEDFDYSKHWTNPSDFPTFEAEEAKVRSDMQELYTQIAGALNTLTAALKAATAAGYLGVDTVGNHSGLTNIQEALNALSDDISQISSEGVEDGGVTTVKLADGAVTTVKMANGAVTADKLGSQEVTTAKIADGAVTRDKIANQAVGVYQVNLMNGSFTLGGTNPEDASDYYQVKIFGRPVLKSGVNYGNSTPAVDLDHPFVNGQLFFVKA